MAYEAKGKPKMCAGKLRRFPMTTESMKDGCSGLRLRKSALKSTTSRNSSARTLSACSSFWKRGDALHSCMSSTPLMWWKASETPYLLPLSMIGSVPRDAARSDVKKSRSSWVLTPLREKPPVLSASGHTTGRPLDLSIFCEGISKSCLTTASSRGMSGTEPPPSRKATIETRCPE